MVTLQKYSMLVQIGFILEGKQPVVVQLGPVVGVHVQLRQRSLADIDAVSDPSFSSFFRTPASWSIVQLTRHVLPHLLYKY